jgi:hypothetical protein
MSLSRKSPTVAPSGAVLIPSPLFDFLTVLITSADICDSGKRLEAFYCRPPPYREAAVRRFLLPLMISGFIIGNPAWAGGGPLHLFSSQRPPTSRAGIPMPQPRTLPRCCYTQMPRPCRCWQLSASVGGQTTNKRDTFVQWCRPAIIARLATT